MADPFAGSKFDKFTISEDGHRVVIRITATEPGKYVDLTLPSTSVPELWLNLGGLLDSMIMAGILPRATGKPGRATSTYKVGSNSMAPGFTAILLDDGLVTESLLLLPDLLALQLADAIEQKVFQGMSREQQKAMMEEVDKAAGRKPRIITGVARL